MQILCPRCLEDERDGIECHHQAYAFASVGDQSA